MRCLSLDYSPMHTLSMQIGPTGAVSCVSVIMGDGADFFPDELPTAQLTAAPPTALSGMLSRLDWLCESLGNTLQKVVIALFPVDLDSFETLQADPTEKIRRLRDQMPNMRRKRLVFRMSRQCRLEYNDVNARETVFQHVSNHDSPYWRDIMVEN